MKKIECAEGENLILTSGFWRLNSYTTITAEPIIS